MEAMPARSTPDLHNAHVTIIGLGLMGGSLALALEPHVGLLTAVERDPETRRLALQHNVVQAVSADLGEGVREADLLILATPVGAILKIIKELPRLRPDGCHLLDLGSTKRSICAAMDRLPERFAALGGHPMCGKEMAGLAYAEAGLYRGQTFVLCPTARTTNSIWSLALALVEVIQAPPLRLSPAAHDKRVAMLSHLPYLVSATLMRMATAAGGDDPEYWSTSASGFRDTTRLAGSDASMMLDILQSNGDLILDALRRYSEQTQALISLLESNDSARLKRWLAETQRQHVRYRRTKQAPQTKGR